METAEARTRDQIIAEIKKHFNSLNDEISAYILEWTGNEILKQMYALQEIGDTVSEAINSLAHTLNKEVQYAKGTEERLKGKNVAKIRRTEHKDQMNQAIRQMHSDVDYTLLPITD